MFKIFENFSEPNVIFLTSKDLGPLAYWIRKFLHMRIYTLLPEFDIVTHRYALK